MFCSSALPVSLASSQLAKLASHEESSTIGNAANVDIHVPTASSPIYVKVPFIESTLALMLVNVPEFVGGPVGPITDG